MTNIPDSLVLPRTMSESEDRRYMRHALMVGDSRTDIDTAKAAGIPVVAVDFGYTDRHVREFDPSAVVSHFDEITLDLARGLMNAAAL